MDTTRYDKMTVSFRLPVDRTADEVREVLRSIGAEAIMIYKPQPPTGRIMRSGYLE